MDNDVNLRTLVNDGGSAVISDYGAHLLRWAPTGQPDVVWTPSTWRIEPGKPLGGGVPDLLSVVRARIRAWPAAGDHAIPRIRKGAPVDAG